MIPCVFLHPVVITHPTKLLEPTTTPNTLNILPNLSIDNFFGYLCCLDNDFNVSIFTLVVTCLAFNFVFAEVAL